MTQSNNRPDRLEAIVELNSRAIQAITNGIAELKLIVATDHEQARLEREELRLATLDIANLISLLDEDRPTILRKLNSIENKVDQLLEQRKNAE